MKAIIFGCLVAVFASCTKPSIDFNSNAQPGSFTDVYTWGDGSVFDIKPDSTNRVSADITAEGVTFPFSAIAFSTIFTRGMYTIDNADMRLISVFAFDSGTHTKLQLFIINIESRGTYAIDNTPGLTTTVKAECSIANNIYIGGSTPVLGTVTIDTLTTNRIHGIFNITTSNGIKTLDIKNGSFGGNLQ